jgi:hypothetical protein
MATAKIRITFEPDLGEPLVVERNVEFADLREPGGREFVAQYLLSHAGMESRWSRYYLVLPDVAKFARAIKQSFQLDDFMSGAYEDRINTRLMWVELSHVLLRVKVLLAKSRAYHDQELDESSRQGPEVENLKWHLHLDKMESFDLAMIPLGKVNERAARLVFERLGTSLIPNLDITKPNWEREITWTNIKNGLANKAANPYLVAIPAAEYEVIRQIFDEFLDTEHGRRGWVYRSRMVHRITPSVDYPGFYTQLENREKEPIVDEKGQIKGWRKSIGGMPARAEYLFSDLYADAVQTFRHYFWLLERLNALPRFSPEAEASVKSTTA